MIKLSLAIPPYNRTKRPPYYITIYVLKIKKPTNVSLYLFRSMALTIVAITLVQCFEFPSKKIVSDSININDHITNALPLTLHMNYLSMELVLFEKVPRIEISRSIFRVTTFL